MGAALLLLLGVARAGGAVCDGASSAADLDRAISAVVDAFDDRDADGLAVASADAQTTLRCLAEPLDPELAARWHAAQALAATGARDAEGARAELRAAAGLVGPGEVPSPLASVPLLQFELQELNKENSLERRALRPPSGATLLVDGQPEAALSRDGVAVLQLQREGEATWVTRAWEGDQAVWRWRGLFPADAGPEARRRRLLIGGSAGALALGAGAAYTAGLVNLARFEEDPARQDIPNLYTRSHTLTLVAAGAGVGALGLGVTAVVMW